MIDITAMITRFPRSGAIGEMDSLYSYWATDRPLGFDDAHVHAITGLMPLLPLAVKCVSLARIAGTLTHSRPSPTSISTRSPQSCRRADTDATDGQPTGEFSVGTFGENSSGIDRGSVSVISVL